MEEREQRLFDKFINAKPSFMGFALWPTIAMGSIVLLLIVLTLMLRMLLFGITAVAFAIIAFNYLKAIKKRRFIIEEAILYFFTIKEIRSSCFFNRNHFSDETNKEKQ